MSSDHFPLFHANNSRIFSFVDCWRFISKNISQMVFLEISERSIVFRMQPHNMLVYRTVRTLKEDVSRHLFRRIVSPYLCTMKTINMYYNSGWTARCEIKITSFTPIVAATPRGHAKWHILNFCTLRFYIFHLNPKKTYTFKELIITLLLSYNCSSFYFVHWK